MRKLPMILLAVLLAALSATAQEQDAVGTFHTQGRARPAPAGFKPAENLIQMRTPGIVKPSDSARRAQAALVRALSEDHKSGRKPRPDPALVRACLKLRMRGLNSLLRSPAGFRRYPGTDDFESFGRQAAAKLAGYVRGLKPGQDLGSAFHARQIDAILDMTAKGMARAMPLDRSLASAPEPPAEPDEDEAPFFAAEPGR